MNKVANGTKLDNSVDALLANRKSVLNQEAKLTQRLLTQREALNATSQALVALLTGKTVKSTGAKVGRPAGARVNVAKTVAELIADKVDGININEAVKLARDSGKLNGVNGSQIAAAIRTNKKRFEKVSRNVFRVVAVTTPVAPAVTPQEA